MKQETYKVQFKYKRATDGEMVEKTEIISLKSIFLGDIRKAIQSFYYTEDPNLIEVISTKQMNIKQMNEKPKPTQNVTDGEVTPTGATIFFCYDLTVANGDTVGNEYVAIHNSRLSQHKSGMELDSDILYALRQSGVPILINWKYEKAGTCTEDQAKKFYIYVH